MLLIRQPALDQIRSCASGDSGFEYGILSFHSWENSPDDAIELDRLSANQ